MRFLPAHIFLLFLFPIFLFSQKIPIEYGKLSQEEKTIRSTELDTLANAIMLCDFGIINAKMDKITFTQHIRIKILNKNGIEEANFAIPIHKSEKIIGIKAQTLNIGEDEKVEKVKLKRKEFYTVDINKSWKEIRFALKDVKVGSIIEYRFVKEIDNAVSLERWNFQNKLPTLKSQLNAIIDGHMDYRIVYNGRRLTQKYGRKQVNNWILTDLPPLIDEPLCPNPEDYTESIRFQLAGYQRPLQIGGTQYVELMSTWENLAKEFLGHKDYLGILKKKTDSKKLLQKIISKEDSDLEKVKKIYAYVQKNIDWNEKYRLFPDEKFTTVFKNQKGSSAEINLCLVRLLQSAGLDANPLIISTKDNGLITKVYPIYNQFNHVIAQVNLGEKDILMDATSKFRPYNLISMDDLNPNGFLLSKKKSRWIEIPFPQKNRTIISSDLSFEGNLMKIKMTYSFFKYSAAKYRQRYHAEKGEDSFVTKYLQNNDEEMMLDSFKVRYAFNLEKPFAVTCYFTKEMDEEMGASILYIAPLLKKHYEKNPFINPTRYLPVDFIAPFSEKYIFNFRLPEGYELAEKPEPIRLATASKKSTYTYDFKQTQTTHVQISSIFEIKDPLIFFDEYGALRELFNKMMGLQSTQLVLKKK